MVNIIIHPLDRSDQKQELVILEFQGNFSGDSFDLSSVDIGNLSLDGNSAELYVGHQRLFGKKVKLAKPFAAIHKRVDSMENCYDVVCILKEKYVFFQRPALFVPENLRNLARSAKR